MELRKIKPIQSVERALNILQCIEDGEDGLTIKELSDSLELNVTTVRGLVLTLLKNGYLMKEEETNKYFLGYEFLVKSQQVNEKYVRLIKIISSRPMERIANQFRVNVWLQVCHFDRVYTIDVVEAKGDYFTYSPKAGVNIPLHASVSGKLYLAYLPEKERKLLISGMDLVKLTQNTIVDKDLLTKEVEYVTKQGFSTVNEETDIGMSAIGVPITTTKNNLEGTLSVVAPTSLIEIIKEELTVELLKAAKEITEKLAQEGHEIPFSST